MKEVNHLNKWHYFSDNEVFSFFFEELHEYYLNLHKVIIKLVLVLEEIYEDEVMKN